MSDDVRWLTYDETAAEFGITRESARQLVIRKRWERRKGNDGKARIGVPEDELRARTVDDTSPATVQDTGDDTGPDPSVVEVLTRHIARLEAEIEAAKDERDTAKAERDAERLVAAQIDGLRAVIEAERRRSEDLAADRDRWAAQAAQLAVPAVAAPWPPIWWPFRRAG